jgi:hypothetical protein
MDSRRVFLACILQMARLFRVPVPKGLPAGVLIGLAVLAVLAALAALASVAFAGRASGPRQHRTPELAGPLSPGVAVRDTGSGRSKCVSCEDQAGVQGGVGRCLDCQGPSFKYLTETIIAEQGADRACRGCSGGP